MGEAHEIQIGHIIRVKGQIGEFVVTQIDLRNGYYITGDGIDKARWPMSWCYKVGSGFTAPHTGNYHINIPKGFNIVVNPNMKDTHHVYTGTNSIFKWPENIGKSDWQVDLAVQPAICECGSHKTYGENCNSDLHSTWCALYKKA